MKVKILKYCQEKINGHLVVLDANKIIDIQEEDAQKLITKNLAAIFIQIDEEEDNNLKNNENKMINILYKKRGRPRKEG